MKKFYFLFIFFSTLVFAQDTTQAEKKIREGISLHDQGKYEEALAKYNEALNADKNNPFALAEKAMTLEASKKYSEAVEVCELIFKLYPNGDNKSVYVTYGNALDHSGKSDLAIKTYDEGIKKYPDYYQLYFNKAIALFNTKENEKAAEAFQTATKLNPDHAASYNALAVLDKSNRIASILASCRYLILDNKSIRAKVNLASVVTLAKRGVSQKEDKTISVAVDQKSVDQINSKTIVPNDFSITDVALTLAAALDYDEKNKDKTEVQKFADKFTSMCQTMKESKKDKNGYYWDFLAPYFIEMNDKKLVEPFANIIFLAIQNKDAVQYHDQHADKIKEFYDWSKNYRWK